MGRIAVVGLTTIDWIDGDTSTPGGVPLHAMRALREFGAPGITATKVAAADRQLLAQVDELAKVRGPLHLSIGAQRLKPRPTHSYTTHAYWNGR